MMATQHNLRTPSCCTSCCKKIQSTNLKRIPCQICGRFRHLKCTPFKSIVSDTICPSCINNLFAFCHIESDSEFYSAIVGNNDNHIIDRQLLSHIKLELKCDFTSNSLMTDDDLDADTNYYNTLFNNPVKYYETHDLNNVTPRAINTIPQFLLHLNARSLVKNIGNIITELSLLPNKPSIIAVTETWASTDNDYLPIPGYTCILKSRIGKIGGGVGLYLQDQINLTYKLRSDLSLNECTDSLFIQLTNNKQKNIIIGVIYKPPGADVHKFTENLEQLLQKVSKEHRPCYLMGDFNIDLMKQNKHLHTKHFLDTLLAYGFYPLINKPTRITTESITLIDNLLTNVHDPRVKSGVWTVDLSDHLPVFTILPNYSTKTNIKKKITKRILSQENVEKFKSSLQDYDWSNLSKSSDANAMYSEFNLVVQNLYNKSFPIVSRTLTISDHSRPWITQGIKKSITKKHSLYKTFLKLRTEKSHTLYKNYRNKLTATLRQAEKSYYLDKLNSVKDNLAKTWKILNSITARNVQSKVTIDEIVSNNCIVRDPKQIADKFNRFFTNVGPDLAKKIQPVSRNFSDFLPTHNPSSIFLKPTNELEIRQIILALKNSSSKGHDNLCTSIIKNCCDELAQPLAHIFNKSMSDGIVPDDLKIAKIIPIYKSDDKKVVSNYRPISVLPAFSKILEKIIYNRLLDFISQNDILSKNQYGFRKNISTSMALIDLVDKISTSIENNEYTIGIFLDLAKAFDTVNHNILLSKLYHYGIRGIPYEWFKNYLTNRHQYVYLNNTKSDRLPIACGVPQGSILGPLLFLIYINDLNIVTKLLTFIMFADDTNIFISGKNLTDISSIVNTELQTISSWFSANLLSLNIKKTNYILFSNKVIGDVSILIGKEIITRVFETKFLGVLIQANLKWNAHVNSVANKISKTIGIINKVKYILSSAHLIRLYQSLIEPYLNYCCIVWATPNKSILLEKLLKLQKCSVRIISYSPPRAHSRPLFNKLGILSIYDICLTQILIFVYKSINNLLPNHFTQYFTRTRDVHPHKTRGNENNLHHQYSQKLCRARSVVCSGPKLWNTLPELIQFAPSLKIFKRCLKQHILSNYLT